MDKIREAIYRLMQGRYGLDQLGQVLFGMYIVVFVLNLVTRQSIFYFLGLIFVACFLFRAFSKNYEARRKENLMFTSKFDKAFRWFRLQKRKWKDKDTHVYRKCPYCQSTIRLPKIKGKHVTNCPKCHKDFEVKV